MVCTDDPTPTWLSGATSSALKAQRFSQVKGKKKERGDTDMQGESTHVLNANRAHGVCLFTCDILL